MKNVLISTTQILEGHKIKKYLGVINTNIVIGTNVFSDVAASFTDFFGGNSYSYQGKMDTMYKQAKDELEKKAKNLGANAILGFKVDFDEISGKGKSMFMLSAVGTACLVETNNEDIIDQEASFIISADLIAEEKRKEDIIILINNYHPEFSEEDWNYIAENPSPEFLEQIIRKTYFIMEPDDKEKIAYILSRLDYADACNIVYPCYMESYPIKHKILYPLAQIEGVIDVSDRYSQLIKDSKLFNAEYVYSLLDKDIEKAVKILDCDKPWYDLNDLKNMQMICSKIDNLPNVGKIERGKSGMFSQEKELFICRNNHKNDSNIEFCSECHENIKGLRKDMVEIIDEFKQKTELLSRIITNNTIGKSN